MTMIDIDYNKMVVVLASAKAWLNFNIHNANYSNDVTGLIREEAMEALNNVTETTGYRPEQLVEEIEKMLSTMRQQLEPTMPATSVLSLLQINVRMPPVFFND